MFWIHNFQNKWANKKWYVKLYDYSVSNNNPWFVKHIWHLFDKPSLGTVFFLILTGPEISAHTNNMEQAISFQLHVNVHKCLVTDNSKHITMLLVCLGFHDKIQLTTETWFSQFWRAASRSMHLLCFQSLYWIRSLLSWSYLTVSSESLTSWYINNRSQDSNVWMEGAPLTHCATSFFNEKLE